MMSPGTITHLLALCCVERYPIKNGVRMGWEGDAWTALPQDSLPDIRKRGKICRWSVSSVGWEGDTHDTTPKVGFVSK